MNRPYVAPGTPVDVYVSGHWDDYHNGNQPVITVPNGAGETKKYHLPHGAIVTTRPDLVEELTFTVDKTPAPPRKLRTLKPSATTYGGGNLLWFEVKPDWFVLAESRYKANTKYVEHGSHYGQPLADLERDYTLTDVTDTGEPLDDIDRYALATGEYEHFKETVDMVLSPRQEDHETVTLPPQPGDRVRVTYEAKYLEQWEDGRHNLVVCSGAARGNNVIPSDAEIRVVARAKPAVPEEPKCEVEQEWDSETVDTWVYDSDSGDYYNGAEYKRWSLLWAYSQECATKLYPIRRERGPAIGG